MSCVMELLSKTIASRVALEPLRITAHVNFSKWYCSWDRTVKIATISPQTQNLGPQERRKKKNSGKILAPALGLLDKRDPLVKIPSHSGYRVKNI
ncbi:hypothetical protein TNIN_159181 [Trichonephila inaurata madagascariensis]|uniref:Uncharacterized protein n=1 Tax=Trichonephila inaurata madagascariensis TaxID=2747483 RepID=A0A8X6YU16_9ARAC|nr:hypothetical protein TNIN_472131 [Trichonephila inaurata madagascariensis]GFY79240.1 hypothetical protein TNIN_159181 [Trichonephila inaurata madagascariensis]